MLATSSCAAITLPRPPTAEDETLLSSCGQHGRCAVAWDRSVGEREDFAAGLRSTGLFSDVVAVDTGAIPEDVDWIVWMTSASYIEPHNNFCPDESDLLSLFSLGIIPIVRSREMLREFVVTQPRMEPTRGNSSYVRGRVTGVEGWLGLPLLLMPWWFAPVESSARTEREARLLAVELCRRGALDAAAPAR